MHPTARRRRTRSRTCVRPSIRSTARTPWPAAPPRRQALDTQRADDRNLTTAVPSVSLVLRVLIILLRALISPFLPVMVVLSYFAALGA
nr:MMPL family transporter [Streptomyces sp. ATCC 21386]